VLPFLERFNADLIDQSTSDARSLEDTLDRAWTVASTLPREDLSMVSPRVLDARYRPAGDADPRPAR
jgi:vacuolar-type H+-ATPase subunit B/Vma2